MDRAEGALLVAEKALASVRELTAAVEMLRSELGRVVSEGVGAEVAKAIAALPTPKDGRDGQSVKGDTGADGKSLTADDVQPLVQAAFSAWAVDFERRAHDIVQRSIERIPPPVKGQDGKDGKDGKSFTPEELELWLSKAEASVMERIWKSELLAEALRSTAAVAVAKLPLPKDGKDADPVAVEKIVDAKVKAAVEAIPKPKDGEPGKDAEPATIRAEVERAVAALPPPPKGEDGKSFAVEELQALMSEAEDRVVERIGKSASVADALRAEVSRAVDALPPPKGPDVETLRLCAAEVLPEMVRTAQAVLAERLENWIASVPKPKDGEPGKSITVEDVKPLVEAELVRWALDFERRAADVLQRSVANLAKPKDGADGLGFDDLTFEHDGGRNAVLRFARGDQVKEFKIRLPAFIDRGIYKAGEKYQTGDGVTYGGSFFLAQVDTASAPESGPDWRLACKRGRDGK